VAELLPAVSGFLLEKELKFLGKLLHNPEKPYVAILGGAKVSDKIDVIRNLLKSVDTLLIGGAMAFTFLKIQGYEVGTSRVEPEKEEEARKILEDATLRNVTIEFPIDLVVAGEMKEGVPHKVVAIKDMPSDMMGLDIGPGTVELFRKHLKGEDGLLERSHGRLRNERFRRRHAGSGEDPGGDGSTRLRGRR